MLVRQYQRKVYAMVRKMVVDHNDADDITQEVFIKVWNHLDGFQANAKLYTWIYRIAANESLSHLRKKRRRFFLPIHDVEAELEMKMVADTSPGLPGEEIALRLQKALLTLPEKQRLVFNLRYFDELSYADMAEVTGTSEGALKASYHLAVKKLEKNLSLTLND
jgi:RNA polymerase sigma factor (sigma-70 family)